MKTEDSEQSTNLVIEELHGFGLGETVQRVNNPYNKPIGTVTGFTKDRVRVKFNCGEGLYWPQNLRRAV